MIRRTQDEWRALFREHQASGLKATEFCNNNTICPNYFSKRRKELLSSEKKSTKSSNFVTVSPATQFETATLTLQYEQTILKIPQSVSPHWIADLIHQLKG